MRSALELLTTILGLDTVETTAFVIRCFSHYASEFLQHCPNGLDPDLGQIKARVRLTVTHWSAKWLWTQEATEARKKWQQEEHAAVFTLRVLDHFIGQNGRVDECDIDFAVDLIHTWLCILQSLFLENGTWVEDPILQEELRAALEDAMIYKRSQVTPSVGTMS
ncbi:hypothetical protein VTH82DRAFT_510 [Thermothelomyces myriococcoides]